MNSVKTENEYKKRRLERYKHVKNKMKALEEQWHSLVCAKQQAQAQDLSGKPGSGKQTDLSDYMIQLEYIETCLERLKGTKEEAEKEILQKALSLENPNEGTVLMKRYIEDKSWNTISREMKYSYRQTLRIHGKALEHLNLQEPFNQV